MSFEACAASVERGDPDRFLAAMAAPPTARRVLFPLYAFNVEVTRAPWVTQEPMIAEMRLQWWRDALEEIAEGRPVRSHEVTTPLAAVLDSEGARALDRLVAARRWDIYKDAFEDEAHFKDYLDATSGELMWQAVRLLGGSALARQEDQARADDPDDPATAEGIVRRVGYATGLARFFRAVPALEAAGRIPLVDGRAEVIADLARIAVAFDAGFWPITKRCVPPAARAGLLESWEAAPILSQAMKQPQRVANGTLGLSPFYSRMRLLRWSLGGAG